jgi:hypothetical protein
VITFKDIAISVSRPLFSAVVAAVVAGGSVFYFLESTTHVVRLVVGLSILLAVYIGMLFYVMGQKRFYLDLVVTLTRKSPPNSRVGLA